MNECLGFNILFIICIKLLSHLLIFFWLFIGCFILKTDMPIMLRYLGYYFNPIQFFSEEWRQKHLLSNDQQVTY